LFLKATVDYVKMTQLCIDNHQFTCEIAILKGVSTSIAIIEHTILIMIQLFIK